MKHFIIDPQPVGDLTSVSSVTHTLYGKVAVDWIRKDGTYSVKVSVPIGCTAAVVMPDGSSHTVKSGEYMFECKF
jgi:hypothetical protein